MQDSLAQQFNQKKDYLVIRELKEIKDSFKHIQGFPNWLEFHNKEMGVKRDIPCYLGQKLCAIRLSQNLTQAEMLQLVAPDYNPEHRALISQYEAGRNEPPLPILNRYAELAQISLETLTRDDLKLPAELNQWMFANGNRRQKKRHAGGRKTSKTDATNNNATNILNGKNNAADILNKKNNSAKIPSQADVLSENFSDKASSKILNLDDNTFDDGNHLLPSEDNIIGVANLSPTAPLAAFNDACKSCDEQNSNLSANDKDAPNKMLLNKDTLNKIPSLFASNEQTSPNLFSSGQPITAPDQVSPSFSD